MKGKIVVVPFSYPFYPKEVIENQIEKSKILLHNVSPVFLETVFGPDDIEKTRDSLRSENPALVVALIVSWVEAPNLIDALREYFGRPLILWSHTTFQLEGRKQTVGAFVAAGVIKQTLEDFNVPFEFLYGHPEDSRISDKIRMFNSVAATIGRLKDTRIGLVGYPALGMYTGTVDHITLKKIFGPEIVHLDQYQIINKVNSMSDEDVEQELNDLNNKVHVAEGVKESALVESAKMYRALKSLVEENNLDAVTVKCQYELSQIYKFTPCVALSLAGDHIPASCEGDLLTMLSQVVLSYLTGSVVTYGDIHEVLEDRILVGACGFSPFSMSDEKECMVSEWGWEAFSGVLNSSPLKKAPKVTLARFSRDGQGFKLHTAVGESVGRSEWNEVGCPPYPGTDIVLDGDPESFAREIVSNHYALVFGDVSRELELLCSWLHIRYIRT